MSLLFQILLLIVHACSSLLHVLGTYLLCTCTRHDKHNVQHLFVINLALSELTSSTIWIVEVATPLLRLSTNSYVSNVLHHANTTMVSLVLYLTMLYITLNALLDATHHLRYRVYWNTKRVKCLIVVTWVMGVIFLLCVLAAHEITNALDLYRPLHVYLYTPLNALFVLVALFTCLTVYHNYARTVAELKYQRATKNQLREMFPPGFYMPVLLMVSFVMLVIVPSVSYVFTAWKPGSGVERGVFSSVCSVLYGVCSILHGLFYVCLQRETRRRLWTAVTLGRVGRYRVPKKGNIFTMMGDNESAIFWLNKKDDVSVILGGPESLV